MATRIGAWTATVASGTQVDVVLNSGTGANAQEGDILLLHWAWANGTGTTGPTITFASGSHTAPTNLVAVSSPASGSVTSGVWAWRVPASKPNYIRFTASPTDDGNVNTVIIRGADIEDFLAQATAWAGSSQVTSTPPSISDTVEGALIFAGVDIASGSEVVSVSGTGWSQLLSATERRGYMAERTASTGGTVTGPTFSWPTAGAYRPRSWMVVVNVAAVVTPTLSRTLVGASSSTGFEASCQTASAERVRLKVGTNSGVTTGLVYSGWETPDSAGYAHAGVTGLTPDTDYWYLWEMEDSAEGVTNSTIYGPVHMADPTDFTVAFGSCYNPGYHGVNGLYPSFSRILTRDPDLFFHLGDWNYEDRVSTSQGQHRADFEESFDVSSSLRNLWEVTPSVYKQGDHCSGGDTEFPGTWTSPNRAAARQVFPYPSLPDGLALYHSVVVGRVRFIFTDDYTYANTDGSTRLGATQRAWFLNELAQPEPVKVWLSASIWNEHDDYVPADGPDDAWGFFTAERNMIVDYIQNDMVGQLLILSGDSHGLFADDGTNTWCGSPTFSAAPFLQYGSVKTTNGASDWSEGGDWNSGNLSSRYGWLHITDDGQTITLDMAGYDESDTALITLQVEVPTLEVKSVTSTVALSLDLDATASKTTGVTGAFELGLSTNSDPSKAVEAGGDVALALGLTTAVGKAAAVAGALDALLGVDGGSAKSASASGALSLTLGVGGTASGSSELDSTVGSLSLALGLAGTAVKEAATAGTLALAFSIAGSSAKASAAAGEVGLSLSTEGEVAAQHDGVPSTTGRVGLTLGVSGSVVKSTSTAGSLALSLLTAASARKARDTQGVIDLTLAITGESNLPPEYQDIEIVLGPMEQVAILELHDLEQGASWA